MQEEHLYQTYVNSYKKLKYWIGNFYLTVLILVLIYSSNPNFFQHEEVNKKYHLSLQLKKFYNLKENVKDSLIVDSVFSEVLRFTTQKNPLTYREDQEGVWLESKKAFLDSLKLLIKSPGTHKIIDEYKIALGKNLKDTLQKYRNLFLNDKMSRNIKLKKYQDLYHNNLTGELDSLYDEFMVKKIKPQIYEENFVSELEKKKTFFSFHKHILAEYDKVKVINNTAVAKIPFSELSINLQIFLILITLLTYFTSYYLPIIYEYYLLLNKQIETLNLESILKVPTGLNILLNLNDDEKKVKNLLTISKWFKFFTIYFFPKVVFFVLLYLILKKIYLWLILLICMIVLRYYGNSYLNIKLDILPKIKNNILSK